MQGKFLNNLFFIIVLNLLIKPFWVLGVDVGVQKAVGPDSYGVYFSLLNFSYLFFIILDFGINNYINREISQNPTGVKKWFVSLFWIKGLLGLVFLGVIIFVGFYLVKYPPQYRWILVGIGFNHVLQTFLLYIRSNIAGLQLFKIDSIISVLDRSLMIVIVSILLWGHVLDGPFEIKHFILGQSAAYIITVLVALAVMLRRVPLSWPELDYVFIKRVFRQSLPFATLALVMAMYYRIDAVMLERLLPDGPRQAGIYAQGYKLPDAAVMFALLFSTLLYPLFSRMLATKKDVRPLVSLSSRLLFVPVIALSATVLAYPDELMNLLYLEAISESAACLEVLIITFVPLSMTYIFGTLLTANGNLKLLNVTSLVGLLVNVVLNLIFIPQWQAFGSAVATLVTQTLVIAIQLYYVHRKFELIPSEKTIVHFLTYMAGIVLLLWGAHELDYKWYEEAIALFCLALIGGLASNLLGFKELLKWSRADEIE